MSAADLAPIAARYPDLFTQDHWTVIHSSTYAPLMFAGIPTLPEHVLELFAAHENQSVRDEVWMNPGSTPRVRALAEKFGVSDGLDEVMKWRHADGSRGCGWYAPNGRPLSR